MNPNNLTPEQLEKLYNPYTKNVIPGWRRCSHCNTWKPTNEYYKNKAIKADGRTAECKDCHNLLRRTKYASMRARIERKYHQANREKRRQIKKAYNKTAHGKAILRANKAISKRIAAGNMPAASELECDRCDAQAEEYHHHKGYAKKHRYDVIPLCRNCHLEAHGKSPRN